MEWSGTLLYRTEGEFGTESFKCIAEYIYLQDIGTHTYTEYDLGKDVVSFMMKNPKYMDYRMGHIHSHNTMSVFFSGTDTSEIKDNSEFHAYYLSLIVNNDNDMRAKIAFRVKKITEGKVTYRYSYVDSNQALAEEDAAKEETIVLIYECNIQKPEILPVVGEGFLARLQDVQRANDDKAAKRRESSGAGKLFDGQGYYRGGRGQREEEATKEDRGQRRFQERPNSTGGFDVAKRYQNWQDSEVGEMGLTQADLFDINYGPNGVARLKDSAIDKVADDDMDNMSLEEILSPATDMQCIELIAQILTRDVNNTIPIALIMQQIDDETPPAGYYHNHRCFEDIEKFAPIAYLNMFPADKEMEGYVPTMEKIAWVLEASMPKKFELVTEGIIEVIETNLT